VGLLVSAIAALLAFAVNRHIYNSDNYRYLSTLLVPWSVGFGLSMRSIGRLGKGWWGVACLCSLAVAVLMSLDTARWYHNFGWIDDRGRPVRQPLDDPALTWLNNHPEVKSFYSGYWEVYRLCYLADRTIKGVPYPIFPNRFPEWSRELPAGRPEILIARRYQGSRMFVERAFQDGGEIIDRGAGFAIVSWPRRSDRP
jgi:hypothetical protein